MLITQGYFSYRWALHTVEDFSTSHPIPPVIRLGLHKKLWGTQARQRIPRDIPHHMTSCLAYKAGERRRKWDTFGVRAFVFPSPHQAWRTPALLELAEHCLAMGTSRWFPGVALLVRAALAFRIKLPLSQPTSSLTFTLPILSPIPTVGSVGLSCWLGLNHRKYICLVLKNKKQTFEWKSQCFQYSWTDRQFGFSLCPVAALSARTHPSTMGKGKT